MMHAIHFDLKKDHFFALFLKMYAFIKVKNVSCADPENLIKQMVTFIVNSASLIHQGVCKITYRGMNLFIQVIPCS